MEVGTLGYALLGLLARRPATGYELTRSLQAPIGYFWQAGHSQVYPALARLEDAGLIHHRVVDGPGPRDTKEFSVTVTGQRALAAWVVTPVRGERVRDELMVKVFSLWTADPDAAAALLVAVRRDHADRLVRYQVIEAEMTANPQVGDPASPVFASYATLRRGLSFERHALDWCDWLVGALRGGPTRGRLDHGTTGTAP